MYIWGIVLNGCRWALATTFSSHYLRDHSGLSELEGSFHILSLMAAGTVIRRCGRRLNKQLHRSLHEKAEQTAAQVSA
jgi:hypothetical protein